ncbi:hypothetical protein HanIR_Chr17g0882761 [Helianthus annuus]|nr:hypothetical protein HanIR_Chr17g0882761 [Helianthus annuus]
MLCENEFTWIGFDVIEAFQQLIYRKKKKKKKKKKNDEVKNKRKLQKACLEKYFKNKCHQK